MELCPTQSNFEFDMGHEHQPWMICIYCLPLAGAVAAEFDTLVP